MHIIIIVLVLLGIIFGPQLWAQYVFKHYAKPREDLAGNGGDLARHLLKELGMTDVKVEETNEGEDHYDPHNKAVRLGPKNYNGKSLTAITVAAHEVGHAIQDHHAEAKLAWRTRMVAVAQVVQQLGAGLLVLLPVIALVARSPIIGVLTFLAGIASMGVATIVHVVTLPVEYDASFNKALPILIEGKYIEEKDHPAARRILKAAALTYVAASLASLLNLWRWIAILRR